MRALALLVFAFAASAAAEPLEIAVPRVTRPDAEGAARCDDGIDMKWREALKAAFPADAKFVEAPLTDCDAAWIVNAPVTIAAHRNDRGIVARLVDERTGRELPLHVAKLDAPDSLAQELAEDFTTIPPPAPKAVKLDLPAAERDALLARRDELLRAPTPPARIVAISGFAVATAAFIAGTFGGGWMGTPPDAFRVIDDRSYATAALVSAGTVGLLAGFGGMIALDGADADREQELEEIDAQLSEPDPLSDATLAAN